jgi:hypothetical protein
MSRFTKVVAAFGAGSVLLLSVGQWAHAQTPAQMEYERQQREYRQQQEQQRQEQQRLQQLQNENARRQQEEINRGARGSIPKGAPAQSGQSPGYARGSSGSGSAREICKTKPLRAGERNPLLGQWQLAEMPAGDNFQQLFQLAAKPQCAPYQKGVEFRERSMASIVLEVPTEYGRTGDQWWACFPDGLTGFRMEDSNHMVTVTNPPCRLVRVGASRTAQTPQPAAAAPATMGAAGATAATSGGGASAVLALAAGVAAPGGAVNPVAGRSFFMLRNSVDAVMAKAGIQPAPGVSRLKSWALTCNSGLPACRQGMDALIAESAAVTKTDASGNGRTQPVVAGTYYVFGVAPNNAPPLLWNVKVDLKSGENAVKLDQRNATLLD